MAVVVGDWWLSIGGFEESAVNCTIAQVHLVDTFLLERLIRAGSSLRLTPLIPQLVLILLVRALLLLLGNRGLVQSLMDRPVKETAASRPCQVFLLLHDLARALGDEGFLLDFARGASVAQPFVHLGLPRLVVLAEGHVKVLRPAAVFCRLLLLLLMGLIWKRLDLRRASDLVRLESAVAQCIALRDDLV